MARVVVRAAAGVALVVLGLLDGGLVLDDPYAVNRGVVIGCVGFVLLVLAWERFRGLRRR